MPQSDDHPRCPHCDYILSGLVIARCPECGAKVDLRSSDPKPGWAARAPILFPAAITLLLPAWVSVADNIPSWMSPFALAVVMPFLVTESLAAILLLPALFLLSTWIFVPPLRRAWSVYPWICGVMVLANAAWFVVGWEYGLRYQGVNHLFAMAALNIALAAVCVTLCIRAISRRTYASGLTFLYATWVWLVWAAFPWLGEI